MELPYMWPSFDNGIPLAAQFDSAQRELSADMVRRWSTFTRFGVPYAPSRADWPAYSSGRILSLRPGGQTAAIGDAEFAAEHKCAFWATGG
jgi:carboxylesterase type B